MLTTNDNKIPKKQKISVRAAFPVFFTPINLHLVVSWAQRRFVITNCKAVEQPVQMHLRKFGDLS